MESVGGGRTCVDAVHRRIQQIQKGRGDRNTKSRSCGATMENELIGPAPTERSTSQGQGSQNTLTTTSGSSMSVLSDGSGGGGGGNNNNNTKVRKSASLP